MHRIECPFYISASQVRISDRYHVNPAETDILRVQLESRKIRKHQKNNVSEKTLAHHDPASRWKSVAQRALMKEVVSHIRRSSAYQEALKTKEDLEEQRDGNVIIEPPSTMVPLRQFEFCVDSTDLSINKRTYNIDGRSGIAYCLTKAFVGETESKITAPHRYYTKIGGTPLDCDCRNRSDVQDVYLKT